MNFSIYFWWVCKRVLNFSLASAQIFMFFLLEWLKIPRALSGELAIWTRSSDLHTYRKYGYVGNAIKWRGQTEFSSERLAGDKRKERANGLWTCWSPATNGSLLKRSRGVHGIVKKWKLLCLWVKAEGWNIYIYIYKHRVIKCDQLLDNTRVSHLFYACSALSFGKVPSLRGKK